MKREHIVKIVKETLDLLPQEFRSRIQNVALLVITSGTAKSPKSSQS
jgi:predicted Zn-dependent protease with MMP-like domain